MEIETKPRSQWPRPVKLALGGAVLGGALLGRFVVPVAEYRRETTVVITAHGKRGCAFPTFVTSYFFGRPMELDDQAGHLECGAREDLASGAFLQCVCE
jgi:hypothetical protein